MPKPKKKRGVVVDATPLMDLVVDSMMNGAVGSVAVKAMMVPGPYADGTVHLHAVCYLAGSPRAVNEAIAELRRRFSGKAPSVGHN